MKVRVRAKVRVKVRVRIVGWGKLDLYPVLTLVYPLTQA